MPPSLEAVIHPAQLPGLRLWLDAADVLNGSNPDDGSAVARWHDKSGNGLDLEQASANEQPHWLAQGISRTDGEMMPLLRFDADWLQAANLRQNHGNVHAIVVSRRTEDQLGGPTYQRLLSTSSGDDNLDYFPPDWTLLSSYNDSGKSLAYPLEIREYKNASGDRAIININVGRNAAANNSQFKGDIAEVLIYDDILEPQDMENLRAYLQQKWFSGPLPEDTFLSEIESTDISSRAAVIRARIKVDAEAVTVCWGDADAGDNLAAWPNSQVVAEVPAELVVSVPVRGLKPSTVYYFRFFLNESGPENLISSDSYSFQTRGPVGAIRWDAWTGDKDNVGRAVETSLGPLQYHDRLPFFGVELSDSAVQVRATTQAVIDKEIAFARAAGLDYWAYVTYDEHSNLSLARKLHLSSAHAMDMNFCLIHEGGRVGSGGIAQWPERIARYIGFFEEPNYQTVLNKRPLFFCLNPQNMVGSGNFATWEEAAEAIQQLRTAVMDAGMANPYLVAMQANVNNARQYMDDLGFDAISNYAPNGNDSRAPFSTLASIAEAWWDSARATGAKLIPPVSAGWDRRPRVENPVPWESYQVPGVDLDKYYQRPTPSELAAHLQSALDWNRNNPSASEADALLIYAWNEIDEGGWIVPTLLDRYAQLEALQNSLGQDPDPDQDGMSDLWETWHFDHPDLASRLTDFDADGSLDWSEFHADTDPAHPSSFLAISNHITAQGKVRIEWKGGIGARQTLETRPVLSDSNVPWSPLMTIDPPTPVTNAFEDSLDNGNSRFYRVRAELP